MRPKATVELGSHRGYSFFAFCQAVKDLEIDGKVHAVDTWQGDEQAGFYGEDIYRDVQKTVNEQFTGIGELHRKTFDEALNSFEDGSLDVLHIDGLHTYEAVRHDYETWRSKVRDGGVILFHDISQRREGFGVWKLWDELTAKHPTFEFHHFNGLGVLGVGKKFEGPLAELFKCPATSDAARQIREQFERLSDSLELPEVKRELKKVTRSKSWRMTEPVRRTEKTLRNHGSSL